MLTADDLNEIRKGGGKDTDILNDYKQYDPQSASDIDGLLKEGQSATDILNSLVEFHKGGGGAPKQAEKTDDRPWYAKMGRALQFGASNAVAGLGSTANRAGYPGIAGPLKQGAEAIAPADYQTHGDKFQALSPSTWGHAGYALLEGAPGVAADLGAGAVGTAVAGPVGGVAGFLSSNAGRNFGPNVDARVGGADKAATPQDLAIAGAATGAEGVLNRIGLGSAIGSVAKGAGMGVLKQVPGQVAKAGAAEGVAGAAGDVVNQVGRTAGTEGGLKIDPNEVLNAGALSAGTGAGIRAARAPGDLTHAMATRGVDEAAAARLADRMNTLKVDTSNPEQSYKAVTSTRTALDSNINEQSKIVNPFLKSKGNDTDLDEPRALLNETKSLLKSNKTVADDQLESLTSRLDHFEEGQVLVGLLKERQELNRLTDRGRFEQSSDKPEGFFGGGVSSSRTFEPFLNPVATLKSRVGQVGAGLGGIAGFATGAQLGVMAPIVGKVLAGQMALNAGANLVDRSLGLKNPAASFRDRFSGLDQGEGATAPSARQAAEAAKAQAALKKLQGELEKSEGSAEKLGTREDARRSKQTDQAWSQKAKQDAEAQKAEERRQAEMDKAYAAQAEDPGTKALQEEAMWNQRAKQEEQAAAADAEAEAGIRQGYSDKLAEAVNAGLASRKAREQAEAFKAKQTEAAYKERAAQEAQEAKAQAQRNSGFSKAEAERRRPDPQRVKAAQEEAMWQAREEGTFPQEWSDMDAITAIQKELKARQKASEDAVKMSKPKPEKAKAEPKPKTEKTEPTEEPLKVKVKPNGKLETPEVNPDTITIRVGDQVVERPKESIRNPMAYVTKTKARMQARQSFADEVLQEVGKRQKPIVEAALGKLNNSAKSWEQARSDLEDLILELPEKNHSKLYDIYNAHEGRLRATYDN